MMKGYLVLSTVVGLLLLSSLGSATSECRANYSEPTLIQYRIELDCEEIYAGESIQINYIKYENVGNEKILTHVPNIELTITGYNGDEVIYQGHKMTYSDGDGVKFNPPSAGEYLIQAANITEARFTVLERPEGYEERTLTGLAIVEEPEPEEEVEPAIPWDQIDMTGNTKSNTDPAIRILEETDSGTISGYVQLLISLLLF